MCQLDAFATQLVFPTAVVTETIYATTIGVTVLVSVSGTFTETITSSFTTVAPPASSQTFTWTFSGVVLYVPRFLLLISSLGTATTLRVPISYCSSFPWPNGSLLPFHAASPS
jgi:hypothetical protein